MLVAIWNINSIRSRSARLADWLDRVQPDVVCLQETKCTDEMFAAQFAPLFGRRGYQVAHHGRDHWNGVAVASRVGLVDVHVGFGGVQRPPYDEARLISAVCGGVRVYSIYAPNGRELDDPHYLYKLVWLERLAATIDVDEPTVLAGDFNVAPADIDIYDPVRWRRRTHASPPERAAIDHLLDLGLVDVARAQHRSDPQFTWWSYRPGQFELDRGLRIDLALVSDELAATVTRTWVDRAERNDDRVDEKPSDHAPLLVELVG